MEALSLLRYWKTNVSNESSHNTVTNIVNAVTTPPSEPTNEEEEDDTNDNGPFFDIEFSLPEQEAEQYKKNEQECIHDHIEECERSESSCDELDNEREVKFTLLTSSSSDSTTDVNVSDSPSSELFFRGGFVPVDHSTDDRKSKPPQFRLGLIKPATKFRIMMLKFRKLKMNSESNESTESNTSNSSNSKQEQQKESETEESTDLGNLKVKLKVDELLNATLFKRHNSSKILKKKQTETETVSGSSEEKKFSKETMQRYIRKVKPLYVRVSQKYSEKLKFTGNLTFPGVIKPNISASTSTPTPTPTPSETQIECLHTNPKKEKQTLEVEVAKSKLEPEPESEPEPEPALLQSSGKGLKQGNLPAGLRVVCKHFGKTWSASTAIAAATATASFGAKSATLSNRRDDSLIQQQDGIQSAILHCKRSFKASRDSDSSSQETGKCENG